MKYKALDLFCGAGGASMGLHRAGFDVTGVDLKPQPRYPFPFIQADALEVALAGYDYIWASPMCQKHSWAARRWKKEWPDQINPIRARLTDSGTPYTIENVVGAPLLHPVRLCGRMFGLRVIRHRLFESSFSFLAPDHPRCAGMIATGEAFTVAGHGGESKSYKYQDWADAMGIHWMDKYGLTQSIPPAYSEFIGKQAIQYILAK